MNKKISTLSAVFLMASAWFVNVNADNGNVRAVSTADFKSGQIYYVATGNTTSSSIAMGLKVATNTANVEASSVQLENDVVDMETGVGLTAAHQWIVEEVKNGGVYQYAFKNVVTGSYLAFTITGSSDALEAVKANATPTKANIYYTLANGVQYSGSTAVFSATGKSDNSGKQLTVAEGNSGLTIGGSGTALAFFPVPNSGLTALYLNEMYGNGFTLKLKEMKPAIEKNPFADAAMIQAVTVTNAGASDVNNPSGTVYLKVGGDNFETLDLNNAANIKKFSEATFIVMDSIPLTKDNTSKFNGTNGVGFQFTTVKGADLITYTGTAVTAAYNKRWAANGQFTISNNVNNPDSLIIELPKVYTPSGVALKDQTATSDPIRVSVVNFNGKNILTTFQSDDASLDDTDWTLITFGANNIVKQKELVGVVNLISLNHNTKGQAFGPLATLMDSTLIQFNKPEGQFLVTSEGDGRFTFTNRETGEDKSVSNLRKISDKVYVDVVDTLQIVPSAIGSKFDGFKNYTADELANTIYNMAVYSAVTENVYLTEKHSSDHLLGLSNEKADAANFKLVKFEENKKAGEHEKDSILIIHPVSYLKNGRYAEKQDTLVIFSYAVYNEANGEFLSYDEDKEAYYCNPNLKKLNQARADGVVRIAIKEKKNGKFNLVVINSDPSTDYTNFRATLSQSNDKLYGAFSENKVNENKDGLYKPTDNDLFIIEPIDAPEYRSVAYLDTISIYKNSNQNIRLYEHNSFLAMQHVADVAKMAPAMVVDTAYVRNTSKPQYLLLVRPEYVYHNESCGDPTHPTIPSNEIDTVKGYFLVNMIDSAKAWGNKHDNPYLWDNFAKLAFVKGYHANDTLVILRDNQVKGDSIAVGKDNTNKIGKYAFRYVDREEKSFVIETSYDGTNTLGYIKWLNGTPVVVSNPAEAEVFNMNEEESSAPTANDEISASEVSVIAGNGTVTVKGAAGKKVAISNILGQTIANTVVTSDEATIAAPAGVVVVAVEGEAAVKAIVK